MYTQQFKRPPAGYGGTAISAPRACPEEKDKRGCEKEIPLPEELKKCGRRIGTDELLAAAVALIVLSGAPDKSPLIILALIFILL